SFEMGRASVSILAAVIALASLPFALFGLLQLGATTVAQLSGPAQVTDFVAIYSGAHLAATEPAKVYAPAAVAALDHALTGVGRTAARALAGHVEAAAAGTGTCSGAHSRTHVAGTGRTCRGAAGAHAVVRPAWRTDLARRLSRPGQWHVGTGERRQHGRMA